jgi:hypothetical protein
VYRYAAATQVLDDTIGPELKRKVAGVRATRDAPTRFPHAQRARC